MLIRPNWPFIINYRVSTKYLCLFVSVMYGYVAEKAVEGHLTGRGQLNSCTEYVSMICMYRLSQDSECGSQPP